MGFLENYQLLREVFEKTQVVQTGLAIASALIGSDFNNVITLDKNKIDILLIDLNKLRGMLKSRFSDPPNASAKLYEFFKGTLNLDFVQFLDEALREEQTPA